MKRMLLTITIIACVMLSYGQISRAPLTEALRKIAIEKKAPTAETYNFDAGKPSNPYVRSTDVVVEETQIGDARFDLQTNTCTQNRIFLFDDGSLGGTWTTGWLDPNFADRGTGYNYYDGTSWGPLPTARIDLIRTGWPSYAPWGVNGEIVVSHTAVAGTLNITKRTNKGVGDWTDEVFVAPPAGATGLLWPRMITSGPDNNSIHVIALTSPTGNGGVVYEGMDGALLYFRSTDAGATWDIQGVILPGMGADFYAGISGDTYTWMQPRGNKIAFIVGDSDIDLFMMVSEDNGTTWQKTVIWENPYKGLSDTPMYYCTEGSFHGAIDNTGKIHVVFGINAFKGTAGTFSWYPFIGGIGYWNTEMEPWLGGDSTTLDPDTLLANGHLIGYALDLNGNGEWDLVGTTTANIGLYYVGSSGMPQIVIDDNNAIFMIYSSVTEGYDDGVQNYRHLFARTSPDGGTTWSDFFHLTEDLMHMFDECVFPSAAANSDNAFHILYQADEAPGLAARGDLDPYGDNFMYHMAIPKDEVIGISNPRPQVKIMNISQNYPNPVRNTTQFTLELDRSSDVAVTVLNLVGQKVMGINKGTFNAGKHNIQLDMAGLNAGVYFYTVKAGNQIITKKMIVE